MSNYQYFITLISSFEEVYQEKKINLKKMDSEIKKLEKRKDLTPFLKKIRRRQIISEFTSQKVEIFNPYEQEKGFRKSRTMMYFDTLDKAIKAIKTNSCDLLESGSWGSPTFVVIEKYHQGFCLNQERWFFEVNFDKNRKFKVKKIKDPIWAKGSVNYAF